MSRYSRPLSVREYCPWLSFWRDEKAELKCGLHQLFQIHCPRTLWSHKHRISDHWIALFEKGRPRLWKMSLQLTVYSHMCVYKEFLHPAGHSSLGQWTQPCNTWHFSLGLNLALLVDNSQSEWWFSYFCNYLATTSNLEYQSKRHQYRNWNTASLQVWRNGTIKFVCLSV